MRMRAGAEAISPGSQEVLRQRLAFPNAAALRPANAEPVGRLFYFIYFNYLFILFIY